MQKLLKSHFGYDSFRPFQEEIIQNVLDQKDTFVLMPTGGGKSLCYQFPALKFSGLTLVISPLIALMKDQVDALKTNGINAEFLNSSLTFQENAKIEQNAKNGKIKILYVAPERLSIPSFQNFLHDLNQKKQLSLIAIDEAHCISEWGHDFRPDYRNLKSLKQFFPKTPLIALTATATQKVRKDITQQLNLNNPQEFVSGFDRPNLKISVLKKQNTFDKLLNLLAQKKDESVIIYCFSRKDTENLANSLKMEGYSVLPYHAGLSSEKRKKNQELFIKDEVNIVVATIAFGMGIDKPDVRMVVHYSFPKTLEGYYQEIGRAGRDGLPSDCVLFYSYADKIKHDFFVDQITDTQELQNARQKLQEVIDFCDSAHCRRKHLLQYFGDDDAKNDCQNCDFCLRKKEFFDATEVTQKILSAIIRTGNMFGKKYVIDVLRGSKSQKVLQNQHDKLPVYGIVQDFSAEELKDIFQALIAEDLIQKQGMQYPTFCVTKKGKTFLRTEKQIKLIKPQKDLTEIVRKQKEVLDYNAEVFRELRKLRKELAEEKNVPPFMIFSDVALQEMAYYLPQDTDNFHKITGVGALKLKEYGEKFMQLIRKMVSQKSLQSKPISARKKSQSRKKMIDRSHYTLTIQMIKAKKDLAEIAQKQGYQENTIVSHLEKLIEIGEKLNLDYLKPEEDVFDEIKKAFDQCGKEFLKPVYDFLEEKYSYDKIRFVRLFLK